MGSLCARVARTQRHAKLSRAAERDLQFFTRFLRAANLPTDQPAQMIPRTCPRKHDLCCVELDDWPNEDTQNWAVEEYLDVVPNERNTAYLGTHKDLEFAHHGMCAQGSDFGTVRPVTGLMLWP
jgi:hypothetical protein